MARKRLGWLGMAALLVGVATLSVAAIFAPYLKALGMAATAVPARIYPMPARLAPGMVAVDDWFVVAPIGKGTYAIGEPRYGQCNFAYLLLGSRRALLWDSGPGIRNIARVVARLTHLPVTVLPSHLHFDHVGGLHYFPDVVLPDVGDLRRRTVGGRLALHRFEYLGLIEGLATPSLRVAGWVEPGAEIDLGDREVRLLPAPGHTPDSVVLFDATNAMLFTGDTIYPGDVWAFLPGTDLHAFLHTVSTLQAVTRPDTRLFGGHGCPAGESILQVPGMDGAALASLKSALDAALRPRFRLALPQTFRPGATVSLDAKASWMAR